MDVPAVPRDHFRASLLLVLGEGPAHGYEIPARLAPVGLGSTDRGFLYRTLRAMEADGLVASWWAASPAGPARRTYRVTEAGRDWAIVATATLRGADRQMSRWLDRYGAVLRHGGPQSLPDVPAAS